MKAAIKSAPTKQARKDARKLYKGAAEYNDTIEISKIVMEEMRKFDTEEWKFKLKEAQQLAAAGLDGLTADSYEKLQSILEKAKAMPKETKLQKEERSSAIESAKNRIYSKKIIEKKHGGHIEAFDTSVFESLFEKEDANLEARTGLEEQIKQAKKSKNATEVQNLKAQRERLKKEKKEIDAEIKKATDDNSYYNKLAKPYIDAVKLVKQAENYRHYEDIKALYDDAKSRAQEEARLEEEKEKALKEEQKAMKEKLKAERARKKQEKHDKKNDR